jgi:hypothetical protein
MDAGGGDPHTGMRIRTAMAAAEFASLSFAELLQCPSRDKNVLGPLTCWPALSVEMMGGVVTWGVVGAATGWGSDEFVQLPVPAPNATQLNVSPLQPTNMTHDMPPRIENAIVNNVRRTAPAAPALLQHGRASRHRACHGQQHASSTPPGTEASKKQMLTRQGWGFP